MALIDEIVAYYKLDENTGTKAADSVGSNDGTLVNTPTWEAGKINSGLTFVAGSLQKVVTAAAPVVGTGAYSISIWFKTTDKTAGSSVNTVLGFGTPETARLVDVNVESGTVWLRCYSNTVHSSVGGWNDGKWHHLVVTKPSSGKTADVLFYIDGSLASTEHTGTDTLSPGNIYSLNLAKDPNSTAYYSGSVDEVGFWSRVLSKAGVEELYNEGAGLQYPFAGGKANTLTVEDKLTFSDSTAHGPTRLTADSLALGDALTRAVTHAVADALTLTDALAKTTGLSLSDAVSFTDTLTHAAGLSVADALTLTETLRDTATLPLADAITLVDEVVTELSEGEHFLTIEDSFVLTDAIRTITGRSFSDSLTLSDAVAKGASHTEADSFTLSDSSQRGVGKAIADAVTFSSGLVRGVGRWITDTLGFTDAVEAAGPEPGNVASTLTARPAYASTLTARPAYDSKLEIT